MSETWLVALVFIALMAAAVVITGFIAWVLFGRN